MVIKVVFEKPVRTQHFLDDLVGRLVNGRGRFMLNFGRLESWMR
jgi:hypothetical protein